MGVVINELEMSTNGQENNRPAPPAPTAEAPAAGANALADLFKILERELQRRFRVLAH